MSTISAGTTTPTALSLSGDTTGALTFQVNGTTTAATISSAGNVSLATGNLTFSGTGQRITGDMSNATLTSRLAFQTSTTDGATRLMVLPNGTSTTSAFNLLNSSDANNASYFTFACEASAVAFRATNAGTGTLLPMTWVTGGSERMRLSTTGNLGIGVSPAARLDVADVSRYTFNVNAAYTLESSLNAAGNAFVTSYKNALSHIWQTSGSDRMTLDASGSLGIGGTAGAPYRFHIQGTLPSSSNASVALSTWGTSPSASTNIYRSFESYPSTAAASYTLSSLQHYWAGQNVIGAGSTVTNQYGFYAENTLTGATNNYGFFSNIASGSNRWNFYAAGTANNYFAGRTQVGFTIIEPANAWNGVKINSSSSITLAPGASIEISSTVCGGAIVSVYIQGSGNGGLFWANYSQTVTKLVGNGEATDTGSDFAVYKNAASHVTTLKNKAGSAQSFTVTVLAGTLS